MGRRPRERGCCAAADGTRTLRKTHVTRNGRTTRNGGGAGRQKSDIEGGRSPSRGARTGCSNSVGSSRREAGAGRGRRGPRQYPLRNMAVCVMLSVPCVAMNCCHHVKDGASDARRVEGALCECVSEAPCVAADTGGVMVLCQTSTYFSGSSSRCAVSSNAAARAGSREDRVSGAGQGGYSLSSWRVSDFKDYSPVITRTGKAKHARKWGQAHGRRGVRS